jgi:hypothetical protein
MNQRGRFAHQERPPVMWTAVQHVGALEGAGDNVGRLLYLHEWDNWMHVYPGDRTEKAVAQLPAQASQCR